MKKKMKVICLSFKMAEQGSRRRRRGQQGSRQERGDEGKELSRRDKIENAEREGM